MKNRTDSLMKLVSGSILFVVLVALGLLTGCTDDAAAIRTARAHGFHDIHTTGWSPFSCSDDDTTKTGFRAKNAAGETVEGTVCCGLVFKNCTLRIDQ